MVRVRKEITRSDLSEKAQPSKHKQKSEEYRKYQSYIRSKYWKEEVRPKVLERDGNRCVCCGREEELTCHHSDYSILYHELEGDNMSHLVTLCKYCHKGIHSVKSNMQRFKFDNERNKPAEAKEINQK